MGQARLYLGDEAVARGVLDAGLGSAYGYPGTPSTEILESLIAWLESETDPPAGEYVARWCTNEKAAYEQALGAAMAGARSLVTMKHVGLNVAADPFMNSALLDLSGGLVVAVADDPGMHSSQNEQDTRYYADFARTVCLEPADPQEAYDLARAAFELSEDLHQPVVLRLVTRVAHARGIVRVGGATGRRRKPPASAQAPSRGSGWTLIPTNARGRWAAVVAGQLQREQHPLAGKLNTFTSGDLHSRLAVVTAGAGRAYYQENLADLEYRPHHIHIGYYPFSDSLFADLPAEIETILVLEDGYPFVEHALPAIIPSDARITGRAGGALPATGELTPESVRAALGLPDRRSQGAEPALPVRPPQLCRGCPHAESFAALKAAFPLDVPALTTSDIGCYALGALEPHAIADSVVCMGASVGMAKGAAEAGVPGVVATIGDSTFLHSGIPALIDAVESGTPMTLVILDNSTVAMTGGQPTATSSERIEAIVRGIGIEPEHLVTLTPLPKHAAENARAMRREIEYAGPSVVIARRGCVRFPAAGVRRAG